MLNPTIITTITIIIGGIADVGLRERCNMIFRLNKLSDSQFVLYFEIGDKFGYVGVLVMHTFLMVSLLSRVQLVQSAKKYVF